MKLISTKDQLPKHNEYVLCHLNINNWGDDDDPTGKRYFRVAKFVKGITKIERQNLNNDDERKRIIKRSDEHSNNHRPYTWDEFGPDSHFGQEVDYWAKLPTKLPNTIEN